MALDVLVVDDPSREGLTGDWPAFQFEEAIHAYIFHGAGVDVYGRFAYLRRMIDFYADASYSNSELDSLVADIDRLLPHLAANKSAVDTLKLFRTLCVDAHEAGKSIFLYCD